MWGWADHGRSLFLTWAISQQCLLHALLPEGGFEPKLRFLGHQGLPPMHRWNAASHCPQDFQVLTMNILRQQLPSDTLRPGSQKPVCSPWTKLLSQQLVYTAETHRQKRFVHWMQTPHVLGLAVLWSRPVSTYRIMWGLSGPQMTWSWVNFPSHG